MERDRISNKNSVCLTEGDSLAVNVSALDVFRWDVEPRILRPDEVIYSYCGTDKLKERRFEGRLKRTCPSTCVWRQRMRGAVKADASSENVFVIFR